MAAKPTQWHRPQVMVRAAAKFSPLGRRVVVRLLICLAILLVTTLVVYLDAGGYRDIAGNDVSFLDALYYATVTLTTVGVGDIVPAASHSRLINVVLVTPLRLAFIAIVIATVVELLSADVRNLLADTAWRKKMRNHTIVVGYGTTGRSAIDALLRGGITRDRIAIIDHAPHRIEQANLDGFAGFVGDGGNRETLVRAEVAKAREIIVTVDQDASAILTTLTVRQLNPGARIVGTVRTTENAALMHQSGANVVITSSDTIGRLVGISVQAPHVGAVVEDMVTSGEGLELGQRQVARDEVGKAPGEITSDRVIGVVRNKDLRRFYDPSVATLQTGDELVVVRRATRKSSDTKS